MVMCAVQSKLKMNPKTSVKNMAGGGDSFLYLHLWPEKRVELNPSAHGRRLRISRGGGGGGNFYPQKKFY